MGVHFPFYVLHKDSHLLHSGKVQSFWLQVNYIVLYRGLGEHFKSNISHIYSLTLHLNISILPPQKNQSLPRHQNFPSSTHVLSSYQRIALFLSVAQLKGFLRRALGNNQIFFIDRTCRLQGSSIQF